MLCYNYVLPEKHVAVAECVTVLPFSLLASLHYLLQWLLSLLLFVWQYGNCWCFIVSS